MLVIYLMVRAYGADKSSQHHSVCRTGVVGHEHAELCDAPCVYSVLVEAQYNEHRQSDLGLIFIGAFLEQTD